MNKKSIKKIAPLLCLIAGSISLSACVANLKTGEKKTSISFLKLDGYQGVSTETKHVNWMELSNFYLDFSQQSEEYKQLHISNVCTFTLPTEQYTPNLIKEITSETPIKKGIIEVGNTELNNYVEFSYTFTNIRIVSIESINLQEVVSFVFTNAVLKSTPNGEGAVETAFDYTKEH